MSRSVDAAAVLVEIAVESVAGAVAATGAGADRLELCQSLQQGGLTPSPGLLAGVRARVSLPLQVLIRPRGGDFLYDDGEFAVMGADVGAARSAGADGIVCGVLCADGSIDRERMRELAALAAPLPLTCHRAFDLCADQALALECLIALGCTRVLTSGAAATAPEGQDRIKTLVAQAGARIAVMAGAGVHDHNVAALVAHTGVHEVHLSAAVRQPSSMRYRRAGVPMGAIAPPDEYELRATDGAMVARVLAALRRR
ncbi:MAG TPA: copper homeostasis protein CutC [Planctomycetota bacterium]|nr:copper homeostasis protein CutC [Planctomycetota bacterium]